MANLLPLTRIGAPVLRRRLQKVPAKAIRSPEIRNLVDDMVETMRKEQGVGLAANQVGKDYQIMVLECRANVRYPDSEDIPLEIYFNPVIQNAALQKEEEWEGCLSIPGYRGLVPRAASLILEALDREGIPVKKQVAGFHARIIQHEVDHLNGLFYIDRMNGLSTFSHLEEFNKKFGTRIRS